MQQQSPATPAAPSGPRTRPRRQRSLEPRARPAPTCWRRSTSRRCAPRPGRTRSPTSGLSGHREEGRRLFGYDIFGEGERLLAVMTEAGGAPRTLTIVRGTFDAARVGAAFIAATPGATEARWRDSPLWEGRGQRRAGRRAGDAANAGAGGAEPVRARDRRGLGNRPGCPHGPARHPAALARRRSRRGPAAFIALNVTDGMRARAAGVVELPPGLAICAARARSRRRPEPGRDRRHRQRAATPPPP